MKPLALFFLLLGLTQIASAIPSANTSIIYLIQSDNSFKFYDYNGYFGKKGWVYSDLRALEEAKEVGRQCKGAEDGTCEVFILNEMKENDLEIIQYVNGKLKNQLIQNTGDQSRWTVQKNFYASHSVLLDKAAKRAFLYFGHDIPETQQAGFYSSRPNEIFTIKDFAKNLRQLTLGLETSAEPFFDLIVLSACRSGTPSMFHYLQDLTRYIIAAPDVIPNIYMDVKSILKLNASSIEIAVKEVAVNSISRLKANTTGDVLLAVYDVQKLRGQLPLPEFASYSENLVNQKGLMTYKECYFNESYPEELSNQTASYFTGGLLVFFRLNPFIGKKLFHSGWSCVQ